MTMTAVEVSIVPTTFGDITEAETGAAPAAAPELDAVAPGMDARTYAKQQQARKKTGKTGGAPFLVPGAPGAAPAGVAPGAPATFPSSTTMNPAMFGAGAPGAMYPAMYGAGAPGTAAVAGAPGAALVPGPTGTPFYAGAPGAAPYTAPL